MKKIVLLFALLVSVCQIAYSQDEPKVVVFNQSEKMEVNNTAKNLVKLSLLEPFTGDISLYYERVLGKNISAEFGLGMTIDDYMGSVLFEDEGFFVDDTKTSLLGYSFGLGFRYYPYAASDEFYFAPEFKYRYYHSEFGGSPFSAPIEESKSRANFRISVGYVYFFDDKIFIDYFGGVGVAANKYSRYTDVYNPNTGQTEFAIVDSKRLRPWLTLGVKIGFAF